MAVQNGQNWPSKTITFTGDEELECWLTEYSESLYGPKGRSQLIRRILGKYRRLVAKKKPELAKSSMQKQAIVGQEEEC